MTCGIYRLTFGNSVYIGKSINIEKRFQTHKTLLNNNKHTTLLQNAYKLHRAPTLKILQECHPDWLNYLESVYYHSQRQPLLNHVALVLVDRKHIRKKLKDGTINVKDSFLDVLNVQ